MFKVCRGALWYLGGVVQPGVHRVTGRAQVGLPELVLLGPAQGGVAQALLDDGVEPGQQEVETRTLIGSLTEQQGVKGISLNDSKFAHISMEVISIFFRFETFLIQK